MHWDELHQKIVPVLEKYFNKDDTDEINKETSHANADNIDTKTYSSANAQPKFMAKIYRYIEKQKSRKEARERQLKQLETERQNAFNLYRQGKFLPRMNCSIILHKREVCHLICKAKRLEIKNKTVGYTSGYGGASFRIAKGLTLHSGRSRGHAIKRDVKFEYLGTFI